eukprot:4826387-Pleurochrysis_carterae.AAC.15
MKNGDRQRIDRIEHIGFPDRRQTLEADKEETRPFCRSHLQFRSRFACPTMCRRACMFKRRTIAAARSVRYRDSRLSTGPPCGLGVAHSCPKRSERR